MFTTTFTCSRCGHAVSRDAISCPYCHAILRGIKCAQCGFRGTENDFFANRCPKCGSIVSIPHAQPITPSKSAAIFGLVVSLIYAGLALYSLLAPLANLPVDAEKMYFYGMLPFILGVSVCLWIAIKGTRAQGKRIALVGLVISVLAFIGSLVALFASV